MKLLFTMVTIFNISTMFAQKLDSLSSGKQTIYFEIQGSGQPLFLLSGGPGLTPYYLNPIVQELSKSYQCILVHQRGTGKTNFIAIEGSNYIDTLCKDIYLIKEKLGHKQIILLGHSWGGMLAMHMVAKYPTAIRKLILVSSGGYNLDFISYFNQNIFSHLSADEQRAVIALNDFGGRLEQDTDNNSLKTELSLFQILFTNIRLNGYLYNKNMPEKVVLQPGDLNGTSSSAIWNALVKHHWDLKDKLSSTHVATLIIQGRQDPMDLETAWKINKAIPNSTLKIIEECGHFPWLEQGTQFYEAVQAFLN